jgi:hypothetical membrane protein
MSGLLAFVTFNAGWALGDAVQREAFRPRRDDISYLGALTAKSPWLYNQLAANVSGLLLAVLAVGLWRTLPTKLGRAASTAVLVTATGIFLDGLFRLDCQSIDAGCSNDSWHAHAHKIESAVTVVATFAAIVLLALAFRRLAAWRAAWIPMAVAIPAVFAANIAFSPLGAGAATRVGTMVVMATFAFVALRLIRASTSPGQLATHGRVADQPGERE